MSLLILNDSLETPPGDGSHGGMGYRFTHPETGHQSKARTRDVWYAKIDKYREDNGFAPMPHEIADDQLCQLLPPEWCVYEGKHPSHDVDARVSVPDAIRGTKVLIHWMANGAQAVPQAQADERAKTCARCYFNVPLNGCASCQEVLKYVYTAKGDRKTKHDGELDVKSCAICKCSSAAHVWVPVESLIKGVDEKILAQFPPHCWKGIECKALIERRAAQAV